MELNLTEHYVHVIVIASLIIGYVIKHTPFLSKFSNYIPLTLAVFGAISGVFLSGGSYESIVYGALSGLASTGLHQAFKQLIEKGEKSA